MYGGHWHRKKPCLVNKISAVMAILMGNQPRGLQCNFNNKLCRLCSLRDLDSAKHILFTCDSLGEYRNLKLNEIYYLMPIGMQNSFNELSTEQKLVFFLSGMQCDVLIDEWTTVMIKICEFVYEIYRLRKTKYDMMLEDS